MVVKASGSLVSLDVNGSLSAVGTGSDRIVFTSSADSAPGQWWGIQFGTTAGASTLAFVDVRNGGSQFALPMVKTANGALTVEDSTIGRSSGNGLEVFSGSPGTSTSATIERSMFNENVGAGARIINSHATIDDSGFWRNGGNGLVMWVASGYAAATSLVTGSSIWGNDGGGVQIVQDSNVAALAPDGSGNAIYDNGNFGMGASDTWDQALDERHLAQRRLDRQLLGRRPLCSLLAGVSERSSQLWQPRSAGGSSALPGRAWPSQPRPRGHLQRRLRLVRQRQGARECAADGATCSLLRPAGSRLRRARSWANARLRLQHEYRWPPLTVGPVNTASGSLLETATDLKLAGPGTPFAWTRAYNSQDTSSGALGVGWTHPYAAKLTVSNPTTQELEYFSGSGQRTLFTKIDGGSTGVASYLARAFNGTLKRLSGGNYELTSPEGEVTSFDSAGLLTQIKPRFLPATTLAYTTGKLSSITDSAGRTITITYVAATPALIERVTCRMRAMSSTDTRAGS